MLRDAVHVAEAVEAEVCPHAAGTWRPEKAFFLISCVQALTGGGQEPWHTVRLDVQKVFESLRPRRTHLVSFHLQDGEKWGEKKQNEEMP